MATVIPEIDGASLVLHPRTPKEMIGITSLPDGRRKVRINSSSLAVVQECLRKTKYSLVEGWNAASESPATLFGSAIHSALEVYYTGNLDERRLPKLETMEMMSYGHAAEGEETDLLLRSTKAFIKKAAPLTSLPEGDKRSIQNGVWLLHEYFKKFLDDPFIAHRDDSGPYVERAFSLPYCSTPRVDIELFGTVDFVFRNSLTGEFLPGDHKTTSSLSFGDSSYYDREKPNTQYTIYTLAANRVLGIKTEDFMVNVFEVKARPKTARGSGPSFPRQITKRTEEDFTELEDIVLDAVDRYLHALDHGRWPLGPVDVCGKYGGCSYRQVCASPHSLRDTILQNKFTQGMRT